MAQNGAGRGQEKEICKYDHHGGREWGRSWSQKAQEAST